MRQFPVILSNIPTVGQHVLALPTLLIRSASSLQWNIHRSGTHTGERVNTAVDLKSEHCSGFTERTLQWIYRVYTAVYLQSEHCNKAQ